LHESDRDIGFGSDGHRAALPRHLLSQVACAPARHPHAPGLRTSDVVGHCCRPTGSFRMEIASCAWPAPTSTRDSSRRSLEQRFNQYDEPCGHTVAAAVRPIEGEHERMRCPPHRFSRQEGPVAQAVSRDHRRFQDACCYSSRPWESDANAASVRVSAGQFVSIKRDNVSFLSLE
jgi:hypothetical protein